MSEPDFVGIGYPKCGTTFFYNTLTDHPRVADSKKERHFFSDVFEEFDEDDFERYKRKFNKNGEQVIGEYSPGVLYYPNNIRFLSEAAPGAKYIIMLRNPIDRCFSHYKQLHQYRINDVNPEDRKRFDRLSVFPEVVYSGLYGFGMNKTFQYLNEDQVIILQYEKLIRDFEGEFKKFCEFLGIDKTVPDVEVRSPSSYDQYDYYREYLRDFYQETVDEVFKKFDSINEYSHLERELWGDFYD